MHGVRHSGAFMYTFVNLLVEKTAAQGSEVLYLFHHGNVLGVAGNKLIRVPSDISFKSQVHLQLDGF